MFLFWLFCSLIWKDGRIGIDVAWHSSFNQAQKGLLSEVRGSRWRGHIHSFFHWRLRMMQLAVFIFDGIPEFMNSKVIHIFIFVWPCRAKTTRSKSLVISRTSPWRPVSCFWLPSLCLWIRVQLMPRIFSLWLQGVRTRRKHRSGACVLIFLNKQ